MQFGLTWKGEILRHRNTANRQEPGRIISSTCILNISKKCFHSLGPTIRINKIQNYNPRILRNTNLYTRTKRYYWIDSKIFSQPIFRNLSTPIKEPIACIQIQTGSLVLILVYIFNCLMSYPSIICIYTYIDLTYYRKSKG